MALRRSLVVVLLGVLPALGASFPTTNFLVEAPTPEVAQQIGVAAERYRREKAMEWLGQEMPPWGERCPLRVKVTLSGAGGATTFAFDRGQILSQHMQIEGPLDRLLASVLPHEVTHTVFAYYFRCPVPRWADEGGSVLSEDEIEKERHDRLVRQILNANKAIPLRRLFSLLQYPNDVMALYAEGYSVTSFLVSQSSRPIFLQFVAHGMNYGWDNAAQSYYRYRSVEELEEAWLNHLKSTKRQPQMLLAQNARPAPTEAARRTMVYLTTPFAQPPTDTPTPRFRGQSPGPETEDSLPQAPTHGARPGYLPDYHPAQPPSRPAPPVSQEPGWLAPAPPAAAPHQPAVRLGPLQSLPAPAAPSRPNPQPISPVGYPY
jgi:hypothetical protein